MSSARVRSRRVRGQLKRFINTPVFELTPEQEAAIKKWNDEQAKKPKEEVKV